MAAEKLPVTGKTPMLRHKAKSPQVGRCLVASALIFLFGVNNVIAQGLTGVLPSGESISAGSGSISQSAGHMVIDQATDRMAIDWQRFSIGQGNSVTFNQPSTSAIALNRVLGSEVSTILGALSANGRVFLLNPNGVIFGPTAQVNVGGLVASTLALDNDDFLNGRFTFSGDSPGSVINRGEINVADGGFVALISATVENTGSIVAERGSVVMGAGSRITLDLGGPVRLEVEEATLDALIEQGGAIRADGGLVYLTARAAGELASTVINHTGITEARTLVTGETGKIYLMGDMDNGRIEVGGTLDASAPNGGDGGLVETSAASLQVAEGTQVTTLAPSGMTGSWLIDPLDYTIAASGGDITGSQLSTNLGTANITIASPAGAGNGDIFVNDTVTWSASTGLTLQAYRDIELNADISASSGSLNMSAGGGITQPSGTLSVAGTTTLAAGAGSGDITLNNPGNSLRHVNVSSGRDVSLVSTYDGSATIGLPGIAGGVRDVTIDYANASAIAQAGYSVLSGNLAIISGGTIGRTSYSYLNLTAADATTSLTAGGDITHNDGSNTLGAVTITPLSDTLNVNLRNNSANAGLSFAGSAGNPTAGIYSLTLNQPNADVVIDTPMAGSLSIATDHAISLTGQLGLAGTATLAAGAGSGDISLNNPGNSLRHVNVSSGRDVSLVSTYDGSATIGLPGIAGGVRDVTIDYANASAIAQAGYSVLSGNLAIISGGTIGRTSYSYLNMTAADATTSLTAGGDITHNDGSNALGAVTITPLTETLNVTLRNNSDNAELLLTSAVNNLTLYQANNDIALQDNKVTGSLYLNTQGGTSTSDAITVGAQTLGGTLQLHGEGDITQTGALSVAGATTVAATAAAGDIVLAHAANSLRNVTVNSGRDVNLVSTYDGSATISLPQLAGGVRDVTIDYPNASGVTQAGYAVLSGDLAITSGGAIGRTSTSYLNLTSPDATTTLTAGGDITHNYTSYSSNNLGVVTINPLTEGINVNLRNYSDNAELLLTSAVNNLTLYQANHDITLQDNKVTGSLYLNTQGGTSTSDAITVGAQTLGGTLQLHGEGDITQTGALSVAGATTVAATAAAGDIVLAHAANSLRNVTVNSGRDVNLVSTYDGSATISLPQLAGGVRDVTIDYPNASGVTQAGYAVLSGDLAITSGGTIDRSGSYYQSFLNLTSPDATTTFTAGGAITHNNSSNNLGVVTINPLTDGIDVNLRNNADNAELFLTSAVNNLTLYQANHDIALQDNKVTGSLYLNTQGGTSTTDAITVGAQTLGGTLQLHGEGDITQTGALSVAGATTVAATAAAGDIVLAHAANSLRNVTVNSGRDLTLASTYDGSATISLPQLAGGVRDVTIDYPNASGVTQAGYAVLSGDLAITSGGTIDRSGSYYQSFLNLTSPDATTTFTAGGAITHNYSSNNLGVVTINPLTDGIDVNLRNNADNAELLLTSAVNNLTLYQANHDIALQDNKVTGSLYLNTQGGDSTSDAITVGAQTLGGTLQLLADGDMAQMGAWGADGAISLTTPGTITLGHDITTSNDAVTFSGAVTLYGDLTIDTGRSGGGNIVSNSTLDGGYNLSLLAGASSSVYLYGFAGESIPLASLIASGAGVSAGAVTTEGSQTWEGNTLTLGGNLTGSGTMTLRPYTTNTSIGVAGGTGTLQIDDALLGNIQPGFSHLVIGRSDGTGAININAVTFSDPTTILSPAGGNIALNGAVAANGAGDALILAGKTFLNAGGYNLDTPNGRWLVYSSNPTDTVEGIAGYNKRYNIAYPSTAGVGTGNYMLYSTAPVLTIAADPQSREYGEVNSALTYAATGFIDGDAAADTLSGSLSTIAGQNNDVGAYAIAQGTLAESLGYIIDYTGENLTITPAPLTVTADDKSKEYGDPNPALTASYSGFKGSDTAAVVSDLTLSTPAATDSTVGAYTISAADGTATNYTLSFYNGTLTITPAPLTVTADDKSKVYGDPNPILTASYSGFKGSDTVAVVSGLTLSTQAATDSTVGDYPITAADGTATNYTLSFIGGLLTITPAPEPTPTVDIGDGEQLEAAIATVQIPAAKPDANSPGGDFIRRGGGGRSDSTQQKIKSDNENRSGGLAFVEVPAGTPDLVALADQEVSGFLRVFVVNGGINLPEQAGY